MIKLILKALRNKGYLIIKYKDHKSKELFKLIEQVIEETDMQMGYHEAYSIYRLTKSANKLIGDMAEVGTYTGGSSKIICEAKNENKKLYLFDTFEGIPTTSIHDDDKFYKGYLRCGVEEVRKLLKDYKNVNIHKGLFPQETSIYIQNKSFCLVNLDVDIYESTKKCLEFFYPRMTKSGIIIIHDYITSKGVNKAVKEYFKEKEETIIELPANQCIIIKTC